MAIKVAGQTVVDDNRRITGVTDDLPSIRPTLNLDFANSKQLDPRIDFTRSSTATYWDGKTTAKAEENLFTYSQDPTQSSVGWFYGRIQGPTQDTVAPDGTTTAWTIVQNDTVGSNGGYLKNTSYLVENELFCYSFYAKYVDWPYLRVTANATANHVVFNIQNNTVTDTADSGAGGNNAITHWGIQDVGNGWSRIHIAGMFVGEQPHVYFNATGTGGTSPVTQGASYKWWGGQLEKGRTSPTAYTPTTATPITRYQPVLQTTSANQPRFDHDPVTGESKGLLIEEARTNKFTYSGSPAAATTETYITVRSNTAIAPDGTLSADLFIPTQQNQVCRATWVGPDNDTYCYSAYVKSGGLRYARIQTWSTQLAYARGVAIDFDTGTAVNSTGVVDYGVEDVGNGWYRLWYTVDVPDGTYVPFMIYPGATADGYPDSGNTINEFDGVYYWGVQIEAGSFPTSYIPTSGSQVTRAVDVATMSTDGWYNPEESTVYVEGHILAPRGTQYYPRLFAVVNSDSPDTNNWGLAVTTDYDSGNGDFIGSTDYFSGSSYGGSTLSASWVVDPYSSFKAVAAIDDTGGSFAEGGNYSTVSATIPTGLGGFDQLRILGRAMYQDPQGGYIKKIAYYPARLPNATLQAMTEV